jgi:hypothetical protein
VGEQDGVGDDDQQAYHDVDDSKVYGDFHNIFFNTEASLTGERKRIRVIAPRIDRRQCEGLAQS